MGIKTTLIAACLLSASVSPSLAFKPQADIPGARPVIQVQDAVGNVQVEEQIRLLNGKVEELTFQILQMQEQMRKLQEDNEFRFQELEKTKQGRAQPKEESTEAAAQPEAPAEEPKKEGSIRVVTTEKTNSTDDIAATIDGSEGVGAPPKDLGSVKFDENGNAIGGSVADPGQIAALPEGDNPGGLYKKAYEHILAGEYPSAEAGFRQHIENYPRDPQAADANYWLGESLIGQERYRDAAEVLLKAQKQYPKAKKAPDMLLKLGVSLAALDNKDVACATFAQVGKKYPKAAPALVERVSAEQAKAGC
jgi:tol-pal system protein YbgF